MQRADYIHSSAAISYNTGDGRNDHLGDPIPGLDGKGLGAQVHQDQM